MSSGDPFLIYQVSGVGPTFTYTTAAGVNLLITSTCGYGSGFTLFAVGAPYVSNYLPVTTDPNEDSYALKKILTENQSIFTNSANVTAYGVGFMGMEL
mgnify:CR=1 FL=1